MKMLFLYLAVLNIADALATAAGLEFGLIQEGNPFMYFFYQLNPTLFIALKVFLSFLLIGLAYSRRIHFHRLIKAVTVFASLLYTYTAFVHAYWILYSL